ncbi:type VI secretion system membrane subunit TssM [Paracoccus tegillarcae]|uniref:Type VI secretion system membrane subunit TssM n=1 Tax=Paracoccus tegillarcae TaxID=1529068 RepID=A0A2K9F309_9RHOB|nr:type VI secretion system membrane subunit TssM [Paracoccus tegillarcae]AUH33521.1 type VI secretion system membrane subunit TssM [Paracoccus tegillarcae]
MPRLRVRNQPWLRIPLTILGLILFAVAVWIGLPMTGWGMGSTVWFRLTVIGIVWGIFFLVWFIRWRRRVRAAREIEAALVPELPKGDGKELAERMETALATLKKSGGASYLYDLPWYVIIGPPGAGKTTALANSGIEFPLSQSEAVSGFGGTRYADFWFAEDAVLIDTAGRYTTQDSDAEGDKASWDAFLELLKKSRPNQPINGVILSFSVEDMMTEDPATLAQHAETVRARLAEVHQVLKVDFPVYVMFTKADLIAGFREYFASFSLSRRKLVWGVTFPTEDRKAITVEAVPAEFDKLVSRLSDEVIDRLSEEPDGISRIAIFGLPGQMALLRDNVSDFMRRVFEPTRYKTNAILRGFYFTSGTQEGTPIDQVLGAMNKAGGDVTFQPDFMSGKGKSYFIHDLMRRVIFAEQGWVSLDEKAVRRSMILRGLAFGAIAAVTLAGLTAFGVSYWRNNRLVNTAEAETVAYANAVSQELQRQVISDPDLTPVLPLLNDLRGIPAGLGPSGYTERFGLSQRDRVDAAAEDAYSDALERMLRPRMVLDLEQRIPQIIRDGETTEIYRALKVYLLLGGQGEKSDDDAIKTWFDQRWRELYTDLAGIDMREQLGQHLASMLVLDNDRELLVDIDQTTVDSARQAIAQLPVDEQAYAILQDGVAASGLPEWTLIGATDPNGDIVFATRDGTELSQMVVPAMYTYEGFWSYFFPGLEEVGQKLRDDQWVLGDMAQVAEIEERLNRLDRDLMERYRRDFKSAWDGVLNNLSLTNLSADKPRYQVLEAAVSASASPILALVKSVDRETRLTMEFEGMDDESAAAIGGEGGEDAAADVGGQVGGAFANRIRSRSTGVQRILLDAAANNAKEQANIGGGGGSGQTESAIRPIELIAEDFENWHELLRGEVGKRPVDTLLGNLGAVWQNLRLAEQSPDQSAAVLPSLLNSLTQYNSQLPDQLAGLVNEAEADFQEDATDASLEQMNRALSDRITFFCRENITSAYPFGNSARSLSIDNFARFFGPGGDMEKYFTEYLEPYVERSSDGLRYRQDKPLAGRMSTAALAQFQRAEVIRQAFFAGGGTAPSVDITVAQVDAHPTVESAMLSINDAIVPTVVGSLPQTITWPGTGKATVLQLSPALNGQSQLRFEGSAWTIMQFLDAASSASQSGDTLRATFVVGGRSITYDFTINAVKNPFTMSELRQFECPQSLE